MKNISKLFLCSLIGIASYSFGVESKSDHLHKVFPNEMKWNSNPALPKEIQVAVVFGDPSKEGPLVMRLKIPKGREIPPHWHPIVENVTVLSGTLNVGSGDNVDREKSLKLSEGSFISIPSKHHHYAWAEEDTLIQLNNFGRWEIIYVNPEDDPRNN